MIDTTQIDQPDTPAPVFAARAFKSALFGTPAPQGDTAHARQDARDSSSGASTSDQMSTTPPKPQGILLTPGTATARRKRVSFGHEVAAVKDGAPNRRTRLSEALEKSKRKGSTGNDRKSDSRQVRKESDDDWEEDDDDNHCTNDITLDLNEPHSQSGRYWKGQFEKYHVEAKAEMEKLLKYKQLAKSYAQQKDAEAIQLAEMLKDEQQKVIEMEKKITENASQLASNERQATPNNTTPELLATLTKQTALAAQYRHRVQELEEQLEDVIRGREDDNPSKGRRRRQGVPSPTTQKTLLDTQRELRRARSQLRELDTLREQVTSLKAQLKVAGKSSVTSDTAVGGASSSARVQDLRAQLKQMKEESAKKDEEMKVLKEEFELFRKESQAHDTDTKAVLERAHSKIADLKKEVRGLKASASADQIRPRSWHAKSGAEQSQADRGTADTASKRPALSSARQKSLDLAELDDSLHNFDAANLRSRTLREKYQENGTAAESKPEAANKLATASNALLDRPNLEKPRWQPFVPRSPRNRAYVDDDISIKIQAGVGTLAATKLKNIIAPDLPALAKAIATERRAGSIDLGSDTGVDLLQDRFARLGGPDANLVKSTTGSMTAVSNNVRSKLPPERRAAALARIEQRLAEKKAHRRNGTDKENVMP